MRWKGEGKNRSRSHAKMADCPAGMEVGVTVAGDSINQITCREQGCGNRFAQLTVGTFPGNLQETGCLKSFSGTQCE